jgi:hypothetical protein
MTQQPLQFVAEEAQFQIRNRIMELSKGQSSTFTERFVLEQLISMSAWGLKEAVSIGDMIDRANACGPNTFSHRSIKFAVKRLIEEHGIPIGSSRLQPRPGYFFIVSDEDAEVAARALQADVLSMFRRIKVLAPRSAFVRKLNGQIELLESK